jgi:hypothetical protein
VFWRLARTYLPSNYANPHPPKSKNKKNTPSTSTLAPFSFHKNPFYEFIPDFVFVIQVAKTRQKKTPIAQLCRWQFESVKGNGGGRAGKIILVTLMRNNKKI